MQSLINVEIKHFRHLWTTGVKHQLQSPLFVISYFRKESKEWLMTKLKSNYQQSLDSLCVSIKEIHLSKLIQNTKHRDYSKRLVWTTNRRRTWSPNSKLNVVSTQFQNYQECSLTLIKVKKSWSNIKATRKRQLLEESLSTATYWLQEFGQSKILILWSFQEN